MLALAGAQSSHIGAEHGDRHQHARAGVADRRAGLAGRAVLLAGDAHQPAGRLRDHVERQVLLERAAGAEALGLAIDDRGVDRADHIRTQSQPLDRARRKILAEDVGLLGHLLDQLNAARVLQVDGHRLLVGVVLQEVIGVLPWLAAGGAAGIAHLGVLHLHHIGAHPRQRLGAGRSRFELRQIQHLYAGEARLRTIARHRYHSLTKNCWQTTTRRPVRRVLPFRAETGTAQTKPISPPSPAGTPHRHRPRNG